jgi:hypothetical protein
MLCIIIDGDERKFFKWNISSPENNKREPKLSFVEKI